MDSDSLRLLIASLHQPLDAGRRALRDLKAAVGSLEQTLSLLVDLANEHLDGPNGPVEREEEYSFVQERIEEESLEWLVSSRDELLGKDYSLLKHLYEFYRNKDTEQDY